MKCTYWLEWFWIVIAWVWGMVMITLMMVKIDRILTILEKLP